MLKATIQGLALDIASKSPVVILAAENSDRVLPIWIGHFEAWAIAMELSQIKSKRPLSHDLMAILVSELSGKISKVEVTELREQTFYARIYIETGDGVKEIDARPSDSIALALKTDAPIYVSAELFNIKKEEGLPEKINDPQSLRERLRNINPEDFGKYSL
ncbi:MAG: bifunctional nuclease family protein [Candidatus Zixiibacteriota bacterium]